MLQLSWRVAAGLVVVLMIVGCGPAGKGTNLKTTGVVTLDGKPLDGATVSFAPKTGSGGGGGITDANGHFTVADGLTPGNYDVAVVKMSSATPSFASKEEAQKFAAEQAKAAAESRGKSVADNAPKSLVPEKYTSAKTSGLSAEVTAGGKNNFEFKL